MVFKHWKSSVQWFINSRYFWTTKCLLVGARMYPFEFESIHFNAGSLVLKEKWRVASGLVKDLKVWELLIPFD